MGRIRTIKPEFHSHEDLSTLPPETHLLAAALVNYADDEGYFNANPKLVKAGTNPLREDATSVSAQLHQLVKIGYIEIRRKGNSEFGRICTFTIHQKVGHPSKSKIRNKFEELPDSSCVPHELFTPEQGTGNREQGTGKETLEPQASRDSESKKNPASNEPLAGDPEPIANKALDEERDSVERVYAYYCAILERDPKRYALTPQRREKATSRLRERRHYRNGDLQSAERDLASAVENLAKSDFHRENGFIDWIDHIFKSQECFEKRLNWTKPKGVNGRGNSTKSGHTVESAKIAIQAITNRGDPDAIRNQETGETGHFGLRGLLSGS